MLPLLLNHRQDAPLRLLLLGAHADDIEIGCGATLRKWAEGSPGLEVLWVVFSANPERRREAEASAREFVRAAKNLEVRVLDYRESFFPEQWGEIKQEVEACRSRMEPDVVFTHVRHDRHQDHRVLSELAWNSFRNHLILEYEIVKYDGDLAQPNVYVEVDEATARWKAEALERLFPSQRSKHWFEVETFLGLMRVRGVECAKRYAEAFYCRKMLI